MAPETVKALGSYVIALVVVVGSGILIVVPTQVPPEVLLPFLTGVVGTTIGWLFGERSSSASAERTARLSGAATVGSDDSPADR